jgi:hypothetical protein
MCLGSVNYLWLGGGSGEIIEGSLLFGGSPIDILYTLECASNYSAIQKLKL